MIFDLSSFHIDGEGVEVDVFSLAIGVTDIFLIVPATVCDGLDASFDMSVGERRVSLFSPYTSILINNGVSQTLSAQSLWDNM